MNNAVNFLRQINGCISKDLRDIRFIKAQNSNYRTGRTNTSYGYFKLDETGKIIECERGYSQYKNITLENLEEAQKQFPMRNIFTGTID